MGRGGTARQTRVSTHDNWLVWCAPPLSRGGKHFAYGAMHVPRFTVTKEEHCLAGIELHPCTVH